MNSDTAIRTEGLRRYFGKVHAVDGISLEVPKGIVFGFLGPNGSGKTTTIRLLLGLLEPTEGEAEVLGYSVRTQADAIRERVGALLEHHGLYERLSAEDNLEFYARIWRMTASERRARIEELLRHFGLWDRRKDYVEGWSRGMKQKLAVARAMLHRPPLIFLDEPTAGLDPIASVALREDIAGMAEREGVTVFLTTHNLVEAEKLCHQVGVIRNGKLLAVGAPDMLRARTGGPRVEIIGRGFTELAVQRLQERPEVAAVEVDHRRLAITLREEADTAPLVSVAVSAGGEIEEVRRGKASLEEVFMTIMQEDADAARPEVEG